MKTMPNSSNMTQSDGDSAQLVQAGSVTGEVTAILARMIGVIMLVLGLWSGVKVVLEAWSLYQNPARIERFAQIVARSSNLDKALPAARQHAKQATEGAAGAEGGAEAPAESALKLSYFIAWVIVIPLLLVIGLISMWSIKTGGDLALYKAFSGLTRGPRQLFSASPNALRQSVG
jgi:disulfide bond formation protein DsbB